MRHWIVIASVLFTGPALAQEPPVSPLVGNVRPLAGPPFALALEAAQAAMAACKAKGHNVGVSVVDETGGLRVVLGADGALAADANGSRRAALLSAAQKTSGAELIERAKTDKALAAEIGANRDWLLRDGALPIANGGKIFGAIAVEGHPHDGPLEIACAQAGIDRIKSRLK